MEILSLKLLVTEDELRELARRHTPDTDGLEEVRLKITPEVSSLDVSNGCSRSGLSQASIAPSSKLSRCSSIGSIVDAS